jgi:CIC family chloride channel protein
MSGNYPIILPVMISNTIAYLISRRYQTTPIFDLLSRQDGLDLPSMEEIREQPTARVEDAMRAVHAPILSPTETIAAAVARIQGYPDDFFLVRDDKGRWIGTTKDALQQMAAEGKVDAPVERALLPGQLPILYGDQPLDLALRVISDWPFLPVVHRADYRQLEGILSLPDIVEGYRGKVGKGSAGDVPEAGSQPS